jgi:ABC-type glycerol-3-phosphate transport system substrate-binding protein
MVEYWHLEQEGAVMKKKRIWAGLLLLVAVFLTACSAGDEKPEPELPPEPEEGVLIYAALNPVTTYLKTSIKTYNKTHPEMQIEIRDYSDDAGPERLMTELMLGEVPDIMEMQEREIIYI